MAKRGPTPKAEQLREILGRGKEFYTRLEKIATDAMKGSNLEIHTPTIAEAVSKETGIQFHPVTFREMLRKGKRNVTRKNTPILFGVLKQKRGARPGEVRNPYGRAGSSV